MKISSGLVKRSLCSVALSAGLIFPVARAQADQASAPRAPTKHQLMKECMAKQKASDGGMPKERMKKNCRDVTETEAENAKAEQRKADPPAAAPRN